jgi:hypothetical protein
MRFVIDIPAYRILVLVQRALIGLGDVAVMEGSVDALFDAHGVQLAVLLRRLLPRDLPSPQIMVNARILNGEAMVDLGAARRGRGGGGGGPADGKRQTENGNGEIAFDIQDGCCRFLIEPRMVRRPNGCDGDGLAPNSP